MIRLRNRTGGPVGLAALLCYVAVLSSASFCDAATPPTATPFGSYRGLFRSPARLAADAQGNIYVTDPPAGQVVKLNAAGQVMATRTGLVRPLAVAAGRQGVVYVSEEGSGRVTVFDAALNPQYVLGTGSGEFGLPNHIAVDLALTNGLAYVSDSRTHQIKGYRGSTRVTTFGSRGAGNGQFDFPTGVFVSTNGEVFVVDQNNDRVQVFDRSGNFRRAFPLAAPGDGAISGRAQGISGDLFGRLYVADAFQGEVKVFDFVGTYLATAGGFGEAVGRLRSPAAVVVTGDQRLLVAASNAGRVEIFGLDCFANLAVAPQAPAVVAGTNVTFVVTLDRTGPFTYRWMKGSTALTDGPKISGSTTLSLSLTGLTAADSGTYTLVITGPSGVVASSVATLTVYSPPAPPLITSIAPSAAGQMQTLITVVSGFTYSMDVSSNLVDWSELTTVSSPTGTVQFTDPGSGPYPGGSTG